MNGAASNATLLFCGLDRQKNSTHQSERFSSPNFVKQAPLRPHATGWQGTLSRIKCPGKSTRDSSGPAFGRQANNGHPE